MNRAPSPLDGENWVKQLSKHIRKMSLLKKFLSLDEVKDLQKKGNLEEVGRLAISMGTIGRDQELRAYGSSLLRDAKKV